MPIPQHYLDNLKRVAKRLIEIESANPGCVRLRPNPFMRDTTTNKLKNMGFKKPFLQSAEQFNIDCFLTQSEATEFLLRYTLLDIALDDQGRMHCWDGHGRYMGWQGFNELSDWNNPYLKYIVFLVNIHPFYNQMLSLLEPIKPIG